MSNKKLLGIVSILLTSLLIIQLLNSGNTYSNTSQEIVDYSILLDKQLRLADKHSSDYFIDGLAVGGAFALAITLFFFYLAHRSKVTLLLSSYFLIRAILLALLLNTVFINKILLLTGLNFPFLLIASDLLLLCFSHVLFDIDKDLPTLSKNIKMFFYGSLVFLPMSLFLDINISFYLGLLVDFLTIILLGGFGLVLVKKSERLAILFFTFIFISLVFSTGNTISIIWLNTNIYRESPYLISLSFWLSGFLTIFILSRGYYYQIKDKQLAQQQVLENAITTKKSQEELLVLKEEDQEQLESRVQERTLELNIALQELEQANKELAEKSTLDALTGLYNRRHYDQKMIAEHRRSRRNLTPLSLIMIDIDHFKRVNDTHGHLAGDQCLVWLATKIKESLGRGTDIACRYGGEEFCLILPETDTLGAMALAEELRLSVCAQAVQFQNLHIALTISCGVSTYQQEIDALPEHLFFAADKALYKAKDNGRNQVQQQRLIAVLPSQGIINE
ncbi:MAG: diguanylate cyclase (GGDEF)-like protein [Alteromonadaceae bacterium]|jgi:diguanylate cyclase (GGDEF)-like protein